MIIEYDEFYKCWVVWKKEGSVMFEIFRGSKKDCKEYLRKGRKKNGKRKNNKKV